MALASSKNILMFVCLSCYGAVPYERDLFSSIFAETNTGCIFGGSALGKRNLNTQEISAQAVSDLLTTVQSGGCVDSYIQDQVNSSLLFLFCYVVVT